MVNGSHLYSVLNSTIQRPLIHPFIGIDTPMGGCWHARRCRAAFRAIQGLSILPKDTIRDLDGAGFEMPTLWLLVNLLYLLSHKYESIKKRNNQTDLTHLCAAPRLELP